MDGIEMLNWYKENTSKDPDTDKIYVGTLADIERPELTEEIFKQIEKHRGD